MGQKDLYHKSYDTKNDIKTSKNDTNEKQHKIRQKTKNLTIDKFMTHIKKHNNSKIDIKTTKNEQSIKL